MFTAVTVKNAVFWDVMPCGSFENRRFGGTYRLHLEGERFCPCFAARIYATTDGEESLLQRYLNWHAYLLPWSYS
jgi:hypothetical protein